MRRTKEQKTNRGITLIALVITIIVMLVLVGVTIAMAVNGGLFDYAGKAASETRNAISKEQELANLESDLTVNELIDKYTGATKGVDLNLLNIGDYVNYPVEYTNVATSYDSSTGEEKGYYPRDEFTGWRVLSKVTDKDGNILYIKLISAGVPLTYYCYNDAGYGVQDLRTNFLTTEITSTLSRRRFYKCGFTDVTGTTLAGTFTNEFTDKVQALTKSELDAAIVKLGGSETVAGTSYINDSKYKDLFAIPCKGNESSEYAKVWLATREGSYNTLNYVSGGGMMAATCGYVFGVRPVVFLKPNVQFAPATEKINETTTWDISI